MPIGTTAISGSIATDHLMHFPGRFTESSTARPSRTGSAAIRPGHSPRKPGMLLAAS
jgi:hypothetical protein